METRRDLLKRAWIAPAILTLPVLPSMARAGSEVPCGDDDQSLPPDQRLKPCQGPLAWQFEADRDRT